jgi:hypothetical protein
MGGIGRDTVVQGCSLAKVRRYLTTNVKRAWKGMAQVVEHLPIKIMALSSNPSMAKNKNISKIIAYQGTLDFFHKNAFYIFSLRFCQILICIVSFSLSVSFFYLHVLQKWFLDLGAHSCDVWCFLVCLFNTDACVALPKVLIN